MLLNGNRLGFLDVGVNNGYSQHSFTIAAGQQLVGENVISFVQGLNPNYIWGVTDILLDDQVPPPPPPATADMTLIPGATETGEYGNRFNGQTDADGVVTASFAGTAQDLFLTFTAYDVDDADEIEVLLNGTRLGYLEVGVNNGYSQYSFTIAADQQLAGENVISFVQALNPRYVWGVTDILLDEQLPPPCR